MIKLTPEFSERYENREPRYARLARDHGIRRHIINELMCNGTVASPERGRGSESISGAAAQLESRTAPPVPLRRESELLRLFIPHGGVVFDNYPPEIAAGEKPGFSRTI